MEEDSLKDQETQIKWLKLYMGSLFPIDSNILSRLNLKKMDVTKNQVFVCKDDVHKEVFSSVLLTIGQKIGRKPSWLKVTLNELVDYSFSPERKAFPKYMEKDILFITHAIPTRENKIYGPMLDQVIEERKAFGKKTYVFYKGIASQYKGLKASAINDEDIVDLNSRSERTSRDEVI